jgi:hypothetical protein
MSAFADRAGRGAITSATDQRPGIPGAHDRNATNAVARSRPARTSAKATEGSSAADPFGVSSGDRFCPRPSSGAGQAGDWVALDS